VGGDPDVPGDEEFRVGGGPGGVGHKNLNTKGKFGKTLKTEKEE